MASCWLEDAFIIKSLGVGLQVVGGGAALNLLVSFALYRTSVQSIWRGLRWWRACLSCSMGPWRTIACLSRYAGWLLLGGIPLVLSVHGQRCMIH